jgi:hypothetical protein
VLKEDETCPEAAAAHRSRRERERSTCPDATNVCPGEGEEDQQTRTPAADAGHRGARDDGSGQTTRYPRLPDAIAPSLASTPEFARRNSWCHAIEVKYLYNKSRYLTIMLLVYTESALAVIIYMV